MSHEKLFKELGLFLLKRELEEGSIILRQAEIYFPFPLPSPPQASLPTILGWNPGSTVADELGGSIAGTVPSIVLHVITQLSCAVT